jgi:hypothetical protein
MKIKINQNKSQIQKNALEAKIQKMTKMQKKTKI